MKKFISTFLILILCASMSFTMISCGSNDTSYTCGVCGRSFNGGTSDSRSIIRTNMCSRCYKNYKYATGM